MAQPALRGLEPERVTRVRPSCFISVRNRVKFRFSHSQLSRGLTRLGMLLSLLRVVARGSPRQPARDRPHRRTNKGRLLA